MITRLTGAQFGQNWATSLIPQAAPKSVAAQFAPAADTVKFSGYHPDAVVGIDSKIAGVMNYNKETSRLFFKLKNTGQLEAHTYRTDYPLVLVREQGNTEDPNAIAVFTEADRGGIRRKLGFVPRELAQGLAPLMDRGHEFVSTLQMLKPFKDRETNEWHHRAEMRVEYVTKEGKAPSAHVRKRVEAAFNKAVEDQQYGKVLGIQPEETHSYRLPDQSRRLVERIDNERGEATYYIKGQEVARVALNPAEREELEFADVPEVTDAVKERVRKRLDTLA